MSNNLRMSDELYHYGVLGMKWGEHRYLNKDGTLTNAGHKYYAKRSKKGAKKIVKAEKYLGRKLKWEDGFDSDGSDITKKSLRRVKQHDRLEKKYNAAKKKSDPDFEEVTAMDTMTGGHLNRRQVDRLIKKMSKDPLLDVSKKVERQRSINVGKEKVARVLIGVGTISAYAYSMHHFYSKLL